MMERRNGVNTFSQTIPRILILRCSRCSEVVMIATTAGVYAKKIEMQGGALPMFDRFLLSVGFWAIIGLTISTALAAGQNQRTGQFPPYKAPRTADGKADISGVWQAFVTADIDIQDHDAQPGIHPEIMGAYGAWPAGQGIVEGGEIPYRPEALAKKKENAEKRTIVNMTNDPMRHDTGDPELKCFRPGVPRATYMPFPFQIIQSSNYIMIAYEFAHSLRTIYMDSESKEAPADSWMGWSTGR